MLVTKTMMMIVRSKHYLSKRFCTSSAFHQHASALFKPTYGAFIDGSETSVESISKSPDTTFPVFAPATNEQLCHVIAADKHLTDIAIRNCHDTFVSGVWSRADVRYRSLESYVFYCGAHHNKSIKIIL